MEAVDALAALAQFEPNQGTVYTDSPALRNDRQIRLRDVPRHARVRQFATRMVSVIRRGALMYLSKVQLDWSASRNPYEWHRALWQLFPNRPDDARNFLFRIEQQQAGKGAVLLLQSVIPPLESIANVSLIAPTKTLNLSQLSAGQALRFRLTGQRHQNHSRSEKSREKSARAVGKGR